MRKADFLARVRDARGAARLDPGGRPEPLFPTEDRADLAEWFSESTAENGTIVHHATGADHARDLILGIAEQGGLSVFTSWHEQQIPVHGIAPYLVTAGLEEVVVDVPRQADRRRDVTQALSRVQLGVTGAQAAFARSGALVLIHGPGRPRFASLVPEVHIAVIDRSSIVPSLSHWAAANGSVLQGQANIVFVGGPSRTGDIEMTLTFGVHGPKEVHAVIV